LSDDAQLYTKWAISGLKASSFLGMREHLIPLALAAVRYSLAQDKVI